MTDETLFFRLSCFLIDVQVMGKRNAAHMNLTNKTLRDAVIYDKPALNIVYVPQIFQSKREAFGGDYIFTVPVKEDSMTSIQIPYEKMKPPIVYISRGSIIGNKGFCKECVRAFG